ncbi:polysaccharide lyase 6 family protein [Microbacterium azadirachtae]|uniref:Chondroitinase-B n=1 Tax=Microbacterium azadirachtae TaxID=582680 RepID=A0A0F0LRA3_9MICO|nr:polysaccharide lyase 6 family protein [Microbacterium azadirachtae]KJL34785.1 Chondroitinase-B precursor [Microbacterium azadirachtae]
MKTTRSLLAVAAAAALVLSGAGVASAAEHPAPSPDAAQAAAAGVGPLAAVPAGSAGVTEDIQPSAASAVTVSSLAQLQSAITAAQPGDTIILSNGTYAVGSPIAVTGGGATGNPVTIKAATVGGVTLTGTSSFTFSAAHDVVLHGFRFTQSTTLEVPADSHAITFSRDEFAFAQSAEHNLMVRADDSVVEYSWFHGKSTIGVYLGIEGAGTTEMATGVRVHHNYFSDQSFTGANGGECIRLGVSPRALSAAGAIIENNLFENANGDPETISVKSSGNTIRYNTIRNSVGGIVLRHGNGNAVVGNRIIGGANGIRIYGNDHVIVNNYVAGLSKDGIVIGSGTERDHYAGEPADSRRGNDAPDRIRIALNTLVDNGGGIVGETNRTVPPLDVTIVDNIVRGQTGYLGNVPLMQDFYWRGNIIWGSAANGNIPKVGFTRVDPLLAQDAAGTWKITTSSPAVNAATQTNHANWVTDDLDGRARTGVYDIGAQEVTGTPATRAPLTTTDVGPSAP